MSLFLGYRTSDMLLERLARTGFEGCWVLGDQRLDGVDWEAVHTVGKLLGLHTVDVVVNAARGPRKSHFANLRVWGGRLPDGAYVTDGGDIHVASPEFTLLLAAAELNDVAVMQMLMRYCGSYSPCETCPDGFVERMPMTTFGKVETMLSNVGRIPGKGRLERALRWSAEWSHSPMETNLMLALTQPKTSDGFGLPKPQMNKRIPLTGLAAEICGKSVCFGDLVWDDYVLEYQGRRHGEAVGADLSRALALELMGYKVDFVAYEQFADARQLDLIAKKVARGTGRWVDPGRWQSPMAVQRLVDLLLANGRVL